MKKITLICFGKLKIPGLSETFAEYQKRLARYTTFEVIELKPLKVEEKSPAARERVCLKEAQMVLDQFDPKKANSSGTQTLWIFDETGTPLKTSDWAKRFAQIEQKHGGELTLVIGGSLGLHESLIKKTQHAPHLAVSFGPQTFSHELTRVVLVEQLYRVLSLLAGHPYHNEG